MQDRGALERDLAYHGLPSFVAAAPRFSFFDVAEIFRASAGSLAEARERMQRWERRMGAAIYQYIREDRLENWQRHKTVVVISVIRLLDLYQPARFAKAHWNFLYELMQEAQPEVNISPASFQVRAAPRLRPRRPYRFWYLIAVDRKRHE